MHLFLHHGVCLDLFSSSDGAAVMESLTGYVLINTHEVRTAINGTRAVTVSVFNYTIVCVVCVVSVGTLERTHCTGCTDLSQIVQIRIIAQGRS